MNDQDKSKEELIKELNDLRRRIAEGDSAEEQPSSSGPGPEEFDEGLGKSREVEALGVLAGGIAHELNNILTAIIGNLVLAKMYAKPELEVYDILAEAEKAALRAENLARQLLTFTKGKKLSKRVISLVELIKGLVDDISAGISGIRFEIDLPADLRPVEADERQLRQALDNLLLNAVQSMPEGGVVKILGENADHVTTSDGFRRNDYIKISVEDQGHGIEASHRTRIFDPFFTTRQKGRGLGLTSADSIIRNHGGFLTVDSLPGSGTTFFVHLPQAKENASAVVHSEEKVYLPGEKRILVMEDEQMVRTVLERMLDQCGCEADFARNGQEMIEAYGKAAAAGNPYDAVIIDLVITEGMGGKEAVEKLLEMDPDANAIVSSGYSDDLIMANFRNYGFKGALTKPYNIAELGRVLFDVLMKEEK